MTHSEPRHGIGAVMAGTAIVWVVVVLALSVAVGVFGLPANPIAAVTLSILAVLTIAVIVVLGRRDRARRKSHPPGE